MDRSRSSTATAAFCTRPAAVVGDTRALQATAAVPLVAAGGVRRFGFSR
jgi:hypothetical protein